MLEATLIESTDSSFPTSLDGTQYKNVWTIGEAAILDRPLLALFRSKRCPGKAILDTYDVARSMRDAGIAIVSGFHSPMERECLEFLLHGDQPVAVCPARSIERMLVPRAWRRTSTADAWSSLRRSAERNDVQCCSLRSNGTNSSRRSRAVRSSFTSNPTAAPNEYAKHSLRAASP